MKLELNKVYKDTEGTQWKICCIREGKDPRYKSACGVNKEQNDWKFWSEDGVYCDERTPYNLIELVGDGFVEDLIKEDC